MTSFGNSHPYLVFECIEVNGHAIHTYVVSVNLRLS